MYPSQYIVVLGASDKITVVMLKQSLCAWDGVPVENLHLQMAGKLDWPDMARMVDLRPGDGCALTVWALSGGEKEEGGGGRIWCGWR